MRPTTPSCTHLCSTRHALRRPHPPPTSLAHAVQPGRTSRQPDGCRPTYWREATTSRQGSWEPHAGTWVPCSPRLCALPVAEGSRDLRRGGAGRSQHSRADAKRWRLSPSESNPAEVAIEHFRIAPSDFGIPSHPLSEVSRKEPTENAKILAKILNNELPEGDPIVDFVLINTVGIVCDIGHLARRIQVPWARETMVL